MEQVSGATGGSNGVLRALVVAAAFFGLVATVTTDSPVPAGTRVAASALWALALVPAFVYLSAPAGRREPIPFLPLIGVLYGLYYALPVAAGAANQHWRIRVDPAMDYDRPLQIALLGWLLLLLGYYFLGAGLAAFRAREGRTEAVSVTPEWACMLLFAGLTSMLLTDLVAVPPVLRGLFRFGHSLQWLGLGLLIARAARGKLHGWPRMGFYAGFAVAVTYALGRGSVSALAILLTVAFFAFWIARQSLGMRSLLTAAVLAAGVVSLRGVADEFREQAWYGGTQMTTTQRAGLMADIWMNRVESQGLGATVAGGGEKTSRRSANLDLFADVIRRTPDRVRYWGGETYLSLVGIAVPRVLWPGKPTKELGQQFGHRYGYLSPHDTHTSVNLPFLVEFYANFGEWGVWLGMLVVGLVYRLVACQVNRPGQGDVISVAGLVLLVPLFNIESDFSLIFGGLVLNGAVLWMILRFFRMRQRSARPLPFQPSRIPGWAGAR